MVEFKTDRIKKEYLELKTKNNRLYRLIECISEFVSLEFNKNVVLTEVLRTQAEFEALYAQTPPAQKPARSPHMDWKAVDLRSSIYTPEEITRLVAFCNQFRFRAGLKKVAIYHKINGNAFHFHVQFE